MGKKILVQRRGRGTSQFRAASHKRKGSVKYRKITKIEYTDEIIVGSVKDIVHDPGRGAPVAIVLFQDALKKVILPSEGLKVGQSIEYGAGATVVIGNTMPLLAIPDGSPVFNIELTPGDGGRLIRSSGGYATILGRDKGKVTLQLPSGEMKEIPQRCRATIGIVAGGGRTEKPFVKAGNKHYLKKAKGHYYPRVRGVAMNAVSHPHGGGAHQSPPRATTVSRHAQPGRKVGLIAARRSGRRRGKK
ncbi:MAG: 50S ribosomal protein L2 [Candidatus Heimdallarchaeaceae archaeon]